jgi:hypothetical protein
MIFDEEYKLCSSSLCCYTQPHYLSALMARYSLQHPILKHHQSVILRTMDFVSQTCKTTDKIILWHRTRENKIWRLQRCIVEWNCNWPVKRTVTKTRTSNTLIIRVVHQFSLVENNPFLQFLHFQVMEVMDYRRIDGCRPNVTCPLPGVRAVSKHTDRFQNFKIIETHLWRNFIPQQCFSERLCLILLWATKYPLSHNIYSCSTIHHYTEGYLRVRKRKRIVF